MKGWKFSTSEGGRAGKKRKDKETALVKKSRRKMVGVGKSGDSRVCLDRS